MDIATTVIPLGSIPANTRIKIVERVSLGHYSSELGYFDLKLSTGETLEMVDYYKELDHSVSP